MNMNRCPQCATFYPAGDNFCDEDGSQLVYGELTFPRVARALDAVSVYLSCKGAKVSRADHPWVWRAMDVIAQHAYDFARHLDPKYLSVEGEVFNNLWA